MAMTYIYRMHKIVLQNNPVVFICNPITPICSLLSANVRTVFNKPQSSVKYDDKKYREHSKTINGRQKDYFKADKKVRSGVAYKRYESVESNKKVVKIRAMIKKDESDVFGTLSEKNPIWYPDVLEKSKVDNDQDDDSTLVKNISKQFRNPRDYLSRMKILVGQKKVKEALDLFVDMRRNFVDPIPPHFTFMIGACGRVGYTEMAFKLLRQMTDRGIKVTSAVLTGLFNSCAESPFPEYGLKKAQSLREKIKLKNWEMNQISYHAMIKAFGRCGDLLTAFQIVDEMADAKIKIDVKTYSFLLMSCIDNKESGYTYAIEVWRKMKSKKCLPNVFTCNLLLRATRDCDIGSDEISSLLLQHWSNYSKRPYGFVTKEKLQSLTNKEILRLDSNKGTLDISSENKKEKIGSSGSESAGGPLFGGKKESKFALEKILSNEIAVQNQDSVTSLLTSRPSKGTEILELVNIKTAADRLNLIGGMEGFLEFMDNMCIKPSIKTLTLLLECLPPNINDEEKLLEILETRQVKPDIDFFNILIKRRNTRKETEAAKKVLVLLNKYELSPNIMTFGVLALGCRTQEFASALLDEMKKFGCFPNIEIAGAMLKNACYTLNFEYCKFALCLMESEHISPNERILKQLEATLEEVRKNVIALEQGKEVWPIYQKKDLSKNFTKFGHFYFDWLRRMRLDADVHPWEQYRTDIIDRAKCEEILNV